MFREENRITTEGQRHLEAVIGSQEYNIVVDGGETSNCWPKLTYFMRSIDCFEDYVDPIDEAINDFLPVLFNQTEPFPDELRQLLIVPPVQGEKGIPDLKAEAPQQYTASKLITPHVAATRTQSTFLPDGEQTVQDWKGQHQRN